MSKKQIFFIHISNELGKSTAVAHSSASHDDGGRRGRPHGVFSWLLSAMCWLVSVWWLVYSWPSACKAKGRQTNMNFLFSIGV